MEILTGKVTSVIDGNTFEIITHEKEQYKIMLDGIDCPELNQEFGGQAKQFLEKQILEKEVEVQIQGKDRWGTRLGILLIKGMGDIRFELLKEGLAWTAERNPIEELESIRKKAGEEKKGLWSADSPTPPWIYRRQQSMTQRKSS